MESGRCESVLSAAQGLEGVAHLPRGYRSDKPDTLHVDQSDLHRENTVQTLRHTLGMPAVHRGSRPTQSLRVAAQRRSRSRPLPLIPFQAAKANNKGNLREAQQNPNRILQSQPRGILTCSRPQRCILLAINQMSGITNNGSTGFLCCVYEAS